MDGDHYVSLGFSKQMDGDHYVSLGFSKQMEGDHYQEHRRRETPISKIENETSRSKTELLKNQSRHSTMRAGWDITTD